MHGYKMRAVAPPGREDNVLSFRRGDNTPAGGWQIFDLKLLADMEHTYRMKLREHLCAYRQWQRRVEGHTDLTVRLYGGIEGGMLRRQAEETIRFYWVVRRDFRRAFRSYMDQLDAAGWRPGRTGGCAGF
jgi:hypothetical protein